MENQWNDGQWKRNGMKWKPESEDLRTDPKYENSSQ